MQLGCCWCCLGEILTLSKKSPRVDFRRVIEISATTPAYPNSINQLKTQVNNKPTQEAIDTNQKRKWRVETRGKPKRQQEGGTGKRKGRKCGNGMTTHKKRTEVCEEWQSPPRSPEDGRTGRHTHTHRHTAQRTPRFVCNFSLSLLFLFFNLSLLEIIPSLKV